MFFYGIREEAAISFGRKTREMLANQDLKKWGQLFERLAALRQRPYVGDDGFLSLDPKPLTDFNWYLSPAQAHPSFEATQVPSPDSPELQWLLSHVFLLSCELRLGIHWPKFGFGWTISVPDDRVVRSGDEREEFDLISAMFFERPSQIPPDLWFLGAVGREHAYASPTALNRLAQMEHEVGLLHRLATHYQAIDEPITRSFGEEIERMRCFFALCAMNRSGILMSYLPI